MESKPNSQPSAEFQGPVRPPLFGLRWPVMGIFIILLLHTLVWASDFLIPVTAAFLGYLVLNRPRRLLERIGVPSPISAALFTGLMGIGMAVVVFQLSTPAAEMMRDLPEMVKQIYVDTPVELHPAAGMSVLSHLTKLEAESRVKAPSNPKRAIL